MELTIRGFKKETLGKYPSQRLIALGKKDRQTLGIQLETVLSVKSLRDQVVGMARIVKGRNKFIALTKSLRDSLGLAKGGSAQVEVVGLAVKITHSSQTDQ